MVKNTFISLKYISWSYFLTLEANKIKHFGTKVIWGWLEKKVGRIPIQNITNCYIVIKKE